MNTGEAAKIAEIVAAISIPGVTAIYLAGRFILNEISKKRVDVPFHNSLLNPAKLCSGIKEQRPEYKTKTYLRGNKGLVKCDECGKLEIINRD